MSGFGGLFRGAKNTKVSEDYTWEKPGRYIELVTVCRLGEDRHGIKRIVLQKKVVAVIDPGKNPGNAHRVGDLVTTMIKQGNDYFIASVKKLTMAVFELRDDQIGEDLLGVVFDAEEPLLVGLLIERESKNITTDKGATIVKSKYLGRKFSEDIDGLVDIEFLQKALDTKKPLKLIDREIDLAEYLEEEEDEEEERPTRRRKKPSKKPQRSKRRRDDEDESEDDEEDYEDEDEEEERPTRRRKKKSSSKARRSKRHEDDEDDYENEEEPF